MVKDGAGSIDLVFVFWANIVITRIEYILAHKCSAGCNLSEERDFNRLADLDSLSLLHKDLACVLAAILAVKRWDSVLFGVVALFGSTAPELGFAPAGEGHVVLCRHEPCQPCTLHGRPSCPKRHFRCMNELRPEQVAEAVAQVIKGFDKAVTGLSVGDTNKARGWALLVVVPIVSFQMFNGSECPGCRCGASHQRLTGSGTRCDAPRSWCPCLVAAASPQAVRNRLCPCRLCMRAVSVL